MNVGQEGTGWPDLFFPLELAAPGLAAHLLAGGRLLAPPADLGAAPLAAVPGGLGTWEAAGRLLGLEERGQTGTKPGEQSPGPPPLRAGSKEGNRGAGGGTGSQGDKAQGSAVTASAAPCQLCPCEAPSPRVPLLVQPQEELFPGPKQSPNIWRTSATAPQPPVPSSPAWLPGKPGTSRGARLTSGVSGPWWDSSERRFLCCRVVMPPAQAVPRVLRRAAVPAVICEGCMLARRSVSSGSPVFISSSVMVPRELEGWGGGAEALPRGGHRRSLAPCAPGATRQPCAVPCVPSPPPAPPAHPALQGVAGLQVGRAGSVPLLQLRNAVPVVQRLRLILARPQVDAAPA